MANNLYDKGREAFLRGQINWISDTIKVALIGTLTTDGQKYVGVTSGASSHQFLSSVPPSNVLATKTLVRLLDGAENHAENGVANGQDVEFENVKGIITGLIIYKDTGSRTSSPLIAFIDDLNLNEGYVANGETIKVSWNRNDPNKIFKL